MPCTPERYVVLEPEASQEKAKIFTLAFILLALVNMCSFMGWQMLLTGLPVYLASLNASGAEIGLLGSLAMLGSILSRPFVGVLIDRYGRRGFLIAGFSAMILCSVGYAVFPLVGVILAIRFIHGLAWGFGSTASGTIAADIIPKKRFAEAMGYFAMVGSVSMALGPAVAMWLAENDHAQLMVIVAGVFSALSILFASIMFATSYKQPELKTTKPLRSCFTVSNMFERSAIFPSIVQGSIAMGFICITTFIAVMGMERGVENLSMYFIVYTIVNVASRPFVGRWADQKGFYGLGIFSCLCAAASFSILAFANSLWLFLLAGALIGLGMGTAMSIFNTMAVAIAPPERRGAATSTNQFLFNGGMAVGGFVGGILVEFVGYAGMFLVMAVIAVASALFFVGGGRARIEAYHVKQQE